MRYDPKVVAAAFGRLFQTYPQFQAAESDKAMRAYFEAVEPYETRDIEAAVHSFITGSAPGHNAAYAPNAPQVGSETRRLMNLRLDREARERLAQPRLPPPDIEHSPESQARVRDLVADTVANLKAVTADEDEAAAKRHADLWARTNEAFYPDLSDREMERRLGFSVGDPEEAEAAA